MKITAYLTVTLLVVVHFSEGTFNRHKNKNKGPFGGHLASWGSTALDGFLRYAPTFYDVVPKVAHKLLTNNKKKHSHRDSFFDDYEEDYDHPLISAGKRTMKRINRLLNKPQHGGHGVSHPVYPTQHGYGGYGNAIGGFGGFDDFTGFGGYGHYPSVIPHGSFDELPVHGVFHDSIDFSPEPHSFGGLYSHDLHNFDHGYHF